MLMVLPGASGTTISGAVRVSTNARLSCPGLATA